MLTNDFKMCISSLFTTVQNDTYRFSADSSMNCYANGLLAQGQTNASQMSTVEIGTGGGAETPESYKLEQRIPNSSINATLTHASINYKKEISMQVTNISEAEIIVREIGLFQFRKVRVLSSGKDTNAQIMTDRTVLKEPVTIAPNETKTIQYTIDFSKI